MVDKNASGNPKQTYNITSNDKSISNPTRTGYTFEVDGIIQ